MERVYSSPLLGWLDFESQLRHRDIGIALEQQGNREMQDRMGKLGDPQRQH